MVAMLPYFDWQLNFFMPQLHQDRGLAELNGVGYVLRDENAEDRRVAYSDLRTRLDPLASVT